ncbi:prolyl oligopeptidase family serine peptidase [Luteimonas sp. Y-2-2-4F]|nr:prolyl oligopeptidase family serine peptidase [Luteimonas sp. Y-2-2-4F]MCD9033646.1 prolyl oligopeptidase family serine peptidase [Luteimonas sp. Y-2-2-4F]
MPACREGLRRDPAVRAAVALCALLALWLPWAGVARAFTLEQIRDYDFPSGLVAAPAAERVAWLSSHRGRRDVWVAEGPDFAPRRLTGYAEDDGQDMSGLQLSDDGGMVVYVRGGEHGSNWGRSDPVNAGSLPEAPDVQVWAVPFEGGAPRLLGEGDGAALSPDGRRVAYLKDGEVLAAATDGRGEPQRLLKIAGKVGALAWSPQGDRLAFTVDRGSHALIGVFRDPASPIVWLAPEVARDSLPRWSPDGRRLLFARRATDDGAPRSFVPRPWSIWVADADTGAAEERWASGGTLRDSLPGGLPALFDWAADDRIVFLSYRDGWMHLYSLAPGSREPVPLTPGAFQVEQATLSADRRSIVYSANAGADPDDADRRHLFRVPVDRAAAEALTSGAGSEWAPALTPRGELLFFSATAQRPPLPARLDRSGTPRLLAQPQAGFPVAQLVAPRRVRFAAEDGTVVHGQLFEPPQGAGRRPAVVFAHGGPQRQMLLTWHYGSYYANAYAINQYLASRGFVVLAVNYRLGPFYGHDFHYPPESGVAGGAEYRDIRAAGRFLQGLAGVDPQRIGIYGGSYGGYLTAMALAHDSDLFKAGVDVHGVHDWTAPEYADLYDRRHYADEAAAERARETAWRASPVSALAGWRSPGLLIHGDDDRNVRFSQTVDLVHRLRALGAPHETLVVVDDTHHMMRYANELRVNAAIAGFLQRQLADRPPSEPRP